jgi:hypothetical protein
MTSYQKLKKRISELEAENKMLYNDFRDVVHHKMVSKTILYQTRFKFEDDLEKAVWLGNTSYKKDEA